MRNKIGVGIVLVVLLIFGSLAYAENCPDVVGIWDFTIQSAYYDGSASQYGYETHTGIYNITSQDGCFFYGTREVTGTINPLTGAIKMTKGSPIGIFMTSNHLIMSGTLGGYHRKTGLYTVMDYVRSNIGLYATDMQRTGLGTAIRE